MIKHFPCYYIPTPAELKELFDTSYFVFDTNVLLDIYRLGPDYSAKVLQLIKYYSYRVKIPYHVAEEYHDNLVPTLVDHIEKLKKAIGQLDFTKFSSTVSNYLKDNLPNTIINEFTNRLKYSLKRFQRTLQNQQDFLNNELSECTLQRQLSELLSPLLLEPFTEAEIATIEDEGFTRYQSAVPPGYKDAKKTSNTYGDLIIWKEIIKFAQANNTSVIFISRDVKEDWFYELHGRKLGPRIELLKEFHQNVPSKYFYIYTMDTFIRYANEHIVGDKLFSEQEMDSVTDMLSEVHKNNNQLYKNETCKSVAKFPKMGKVELKAKGTEDIKMSSSEKKIKA